MPMLRASRAFTLSDMLNTLAITAFLLGVALPGAQHLVQNQQLASTNNTLAASLTLARSESIKRRLPVLVDNSDGNWMTGWQVFVDENNDGERNTEEPALLQIDAQPDGIVAKGNKPVSRFIRYTPTGSAKLLSGAFQAGTLTLCHATGQQAVRHLILSASGRIRQSKGQPGIC